IEPINGIRHQFTSWWPSLKAGGENHIIHGNSATVLQLQRTIADGRHPSLPDPNAVIRTNSLMNIGGYRPDIPHRIHYFSSAGNRGAEEGFQAAWPQIAGRTVK